MTERVRVSADGLTILATVLSPQESEEILEGIGALLVARFTRSWRVKKSPSGESWPDRMVPNVPGIVADLNAGRNPKSRRFNTGQTLVDTGNLRRSITFSVRGDTVVIGTQVSYAPVQNEGGTTRSTLTATGRRQLTRWLRRERRREAPDEFRLSLGWLFGKPSFEVNVRKRTFIEVAGTEKEIARFVEREIGRLTP